MAKTKIVETLLEEAKKLENESLSEMINDLLELGDEATGNSPEYKLLKEAISNLSEGTAEYILKCNYDVTENEKIVTKRPDTKLTLPISVGDKLVKKAWAIKVK